MRRNDEGLGVHNGDVGIVLPKLLELDTPTSDLEDSSAVVGDEDAGIRLSVKIGRIVRDRQ